MKVVDALSYGYKLLGNNLEVRILLEHLLEVSREYIIKNPNIELKTNEIRKFKNYIKRRKNNEPIAYITKKREFYGRNFIIDKNVLIPRSDTEILIDTILKDHKNSNVKNILELGVGSGCIIISLLLEMPNLIATGIDISPKALNIAKKNLVKYDLENRCKLLKSDWFENIKGEYDLIISNPPYVSKNDHVIMAIETLIFEPEIALYAENNGYSSYEIIAKESHKFLTPKGKIYIEIGINQYPKIAKIFKIHGYRIVSSLNDISGNIRVLVIDKISL